MLPFPCRLNTFQRRGLRHPQVRRRLAKVYFWLRMAVSGQENLYQNVYIYIYTLCCLNLFDSRNCMLEKTKRHWPFLPTCEACQSNPVFPSKPMSTTSLGLNLMLPDVLWDSWTLGVDLPQTQGFGSFHKPKETHLSSELVGDIQCTAMSQKHWRQLEQFGIEWNRRE